MGLLELTIVTPLSIAVHDPAVASLRGEDDSGGFGILPGHADFLTVIDAGVLRWRGRSGPWRFCAVRGGVLSVTGGAALRVSCREAVLSDDLPSLQAQVAQARRDRANAARQAKVHSARLHGKAIRHLLARTMKGADTLAQTFEEDA